jgi:hypothetical protein
VIRQAARKGLAAACAIVLTATGLQVGTTAAAAAAAPTEVKVIPADSATNFLPDRIWQALETGFVHRYTNDSPPMWTRYADGATTSLKDLVASQVHTWASAGGDVLWTTRSVPGHSTADSVTLLDLGTMTWRSLAKPSSGTVSAVYGSTMLIQQAEDDGKLDVRRYAPDGSFESVELTGIPDGTTALYPVRGDAAGAILRIDTETTISYGMLDLATGAIEPVPDITGASNYLLSADRVAFRRCQSGAETCPVRIYSRADLRAAPQTVMVPSTLNTDRMILIGTHIVGATRGATTSDRQPARDLSTAGSPVVVPMTQADGQSFAQTANGGLIIGGTGGDWGIRRLTATAGGEIAQAAVLDLRGRQTNAGVTLSQGFLRHIQAQRLAGEETSRYLLFNHRIAGDAAETLPAPHGGELRSPVPCQADQACVRSVDSNNHGTSYLGTDTGGKVLLWQRLAEGHAEKSFPVGSAGEIVDVSPGYAVVNSADGPIQYVLQPGDNSSRTTRPVGAAALWMNTLWTSPEPGTLRAGGAGNPGGDTVFNTGAACVPDELQAALRYVYWSCGVTGPAGVVDTVRRRNIALPAARYLLGDGYVVRHDTASGRLLRYDLTSGAAGEPAVVATLPDSPVTDSRNIGWAVDKYSGNIAYVDAANAVHVVDPGVPSSAPESVHGSSNFDAEIYFDGPGEMLRMWWLTRPVDSWTMSIARVATGQVVASKTGGPARRTISATWDGYLPSGARALSGRYRYTVSVTAAGVTTEISAGNATVLCGSPLFRSYDCNGTPSVLGVFKSGEAHWLTIGRDGKIHDWGNTEVWKLGTSSGMTSAIVPFGDLNRDGRNDLLTRGGDGTLTLHHGYHPSPNFGQNWTQVVGTGWGGMKQIVSSGDLTGDGIPDVLAQTSTGVLRRYNGTSAGGLTNGGVIAGTWTQPKLIGPGDVNNDGKADLYTITTAGELDVYFGTGTGTFGAAQRVGTGWAAYTVIGAGDANEDGRNDLFARDSAGTFWLYPGTGTGRLGTRKQLATGYQKYVGLF